MHNMPKSFTSAEIEMLTSQCANSIISLHHGDVVWYVIKILALLAKIYILFLFTFRKGLFFWHLLKLIRCFNL